MFSLIFAVVSTAAISLVMRLSEGKAEKKLGLLLVNYVTCTVLAWFYAWGKSATGVSLGLGAVNGVIYLGAFVLLQYCIGRQGVVLPTVFVKLGLLVPIALSVAVFGELPKLAQAVGFLLALGAIVVIHWQKGQTRGKKLGLLLWLPVWGGMADAMSKIFEEVGRGQPGDVFLLVTFLVALALCAVLAAVRKELPGKWEFLFGLAVGVPNFFSTKLLLRSLATVPGVVAYPIYSAGGILLVTLAGVVVFREKLEKKQWIGIAMILTALVLLNLG